MGAVASLLLPHTPPRTLQPVHETRGQVFICEIGAGVPCTALCNIPTEECNPEVLPRMTIGGGGVFVRHPTVWAKYNLLPQILAVINSRAGQAILLVGVYGSHIPGPIGIACQGARQLLRGYPLESLRASLTGHVSSDSSSGV